MTSLSQAIKSFLNHCQYEKNLSQKTLYIYTIDLRQFSLFINQNSFPLIIEDITKIHLKAYLKELSKWKIKTVKRKVATLKAMYNYLEYEDMIAVNPIRKLKIRLKEPLVLPKALTNDEIKAVITVAYQSISASPKGKYTYLEKVRNAAVIELLFATGARVSEIANLRLADLDRSSGTLTLKGKGNKERIIPICNTDTLALLQAYISLLAEKIDKSGDYLLINRLGAKLSDQSIRNTIHTYAVKAGVTKKVTPHTFRHSFATLLLENDVDIKYIQAMLGHSSITTTQIYTQVNKEKQRQLLNDKHPRMDFSMALG